MLDPKPQLPNQTAAVSLAVAPRIGRSGRHTRTSRNEAKRPDLSGLHFSGRHSPEVLAVACNGTKRNGPLDERRSLFDN
jgi:negative regulator of sigma E activity